MNPQLLHDITPRLIRDYGFKESKGFLRGGVCPNCKQKELYTSAEHPWVLRCGRLKKCGAEFHVKELYPDLFDNWSERFPATAANPNAAAEAYLRDGRGFDLEKIKGWYSQETFWDRESNQSSATVRFSLGGQAFWERLIDRPERFGKRKANFRGDYKGLCWVPPNLPILPEEIWLVEGIFDAIALGHHGIDAVATMSCNNYPHLFFKSMAERAAANSKPRPKLVWALDGDRAGTRFAKRYCERSREDGWEACCAVIPQVGSAKLDWNDMHQRDRLKEKDLDEFFYQGSLLMAATAAEKGNLIYSRHGWNSFPFDFDNRIYWWKLDLDKLTKARDAIEKTNPDLSPEETHEEAVKQSHTVSEICNCLPTPLYYLKNEVTDEAWYYFRIEFPHDGPGVKNTFTAAQLSAVGEFKKRLLHSGAGAIWTGNAAQLDRLLSRWTFNIKTVETVDFLGYSLPHGAYVYNEVAVKDGRVVKQNDEDYFELGKLAIKSLSRSNKLDINPDLKKYRKDWFDKLYLCFGPRGLIALAYWMGTLFAEQIRDRFESFPFLEIVGEPGSGKTTLLETLWKLLGRNGYEGFDPLKGSQVGFLRAMSQFSNLPVVLIESDREEDGDGMKGRPRQAFHWDSLKSLYNGGALRTTGVKSSGNDTYEPQFRAALVISQNAPVSASTPIMERIVHLWMDKSRQSEAGREAALELGRTVANDVSGFLVAAITHEGAVIKLIEERQRPYEKRLEQKGVKNQRIQKNHAQLMVLVEALALVCPITDSQRTEAIQLLADLALEREKDLAKDHPIVERFWEAFDYMNGTPAEPDDLDYEEKLNHSRDPAEIAVSLPHFYQVASEMRQPVPDPHDLKKYLKTSRSPRFLEANRVVNSAINGRWNQRREVHQQAKPASLRCWVFKRNA